MSDTEQNFGKAGDAGGDSTSTASTKAQKAAAVLNTRRTVCEQQMDRTRDFIERIKQDPTLTSSSEVTIRLEALENSYSTFRSVQSKIEERDPEETLQHHRSTYEELYYLIASNIKVMLSKLDNAANTTIVDNDKTPERYDTIRLPKIELHSFSGEVTAWMSWYDEFNSLVHKNQHITTLAKFHHLVAKLEGTAKATIEGLKIVSDNYEVALQRLRERFENKKVIGTKHIDFMFHHPKITSANSTDLRNLIDKMNNHMVGLRNLNRPVDQWDDLIVHLITTKLDAQTALKWNEESATDRMSTLTELMTFLKKRCQILEGNVQTNILSNSNAIATGLSSKNQKQHRAFTATKFSCNFCHKTGHSIYRCVAFINLTVRDRLQKVRELRLCENCLKQNSHTALNCPSNFKCQSCGHKHHSLLHQANASVSQANSNNNNQTGSSTKFLSPNLNFVPNPQVILHSKSKDSNVLGTVILNLVNHCNQNITCRALLDSGSQLNMISERIVRIAGIKRQHSPTSFTSANDMQTSAKFKATFTIKSRFNDFSSNLEALILPNITGQMPDRKFNIDEWNVPKNICLADPLFNIPQRIDLLIGVDLFYEILSVGQIKLGPDLPIAQNTLLGWVVAGKLSAHKSTNLMSLFAKPPEACSESTLNDSIKAFWQIEEISGPSHNTSREERECEAHFKKNVSRSECGRYQVRLPFKHNFNILGDSYNIALKRFYSLEAKFRNNERLRLQYVEFMEEFINLSHMERVIDTDIKTPCYVIPHHCVFKPSSSTTKIRVVFDASSKTSTGASLNELLMIGPVIQPDLFTTMLRFRYFTYVFTADITKMYRQISLHPDDRRFHYILWRSCETDPLEIFQLCTVTYGTSSASFLATRALQQLCEDERQYFPDASQAALNGFYVDDLLTGANTLQDAKVLQGQLQTMLLRGKFELKKWCANHNDILSNVAEEDKEKFFKIKGKDAIKTLGHIWNPSTDKFLYQKPNAQRQKSFTKRSILSEIAQFFDPLGLISPVVVLAKIFMQQLWRLKLSWDEALPQEYHSRWENFRDQLHYLNDFEIERQAFAPCANYELHAFSDSSEDAYGACLYIKSFSEEGGAVTIKLLCAKTRVAPLKKCCIPRLELCAAVIMAELVKRIKKIFSFVEFQSINYWTDSTIVLNWLQQDSCSWQTFVANRVALIQESSTFSQWRYVPTSQNPADLLSRGVLPEELMRSSLWYNGPSFLMQSEEFWPSLPVGIHHSDDVLQRKRVKLVLAATLKENFIENIKYHNNYQILLNIVAYILRFKHNCTTCESNRRSGVLSPQEIRLALVAIVKLIQRVEFSAEIRALSCGSALPKQSKLKALAAFIDQEGILRVGGRLRHAAIDFNNKHPILLPKSHVFTRALLIHLHISNHHVGPQALLSITRQMFWPIHGKVAARSIVHHCVRCSRARPLRHDQLMADMPELRVQQSRPFNVVGVDYCGPFFIHFRRRGTVPTKAYVAIFVCFVTKATHLELVDDLSTKGFLNALKRFIARRGLCAVLYSDNATNFVGARKELEELFSMLQHKQSQEEIERVCAVNGIVWKHIPPRSPHFGGLWEAAVKSFKYHLKRIMNNSSLTFSEFNTLIIQIESILNSRPITAVPENACDVPALTPGHFIIGTALNAIPEPDLKAVANFNRLQRYQQLQWYFQQFWDKWHKDYLQSLQGRNKWTKKGQPLNIGDLVILEEENIPPLQWKLGRIIHLHPGKDGITRTATVKTSTNEVQRATAKIRRLPIDGPLCPQGGVNVKS